MKTGYSILEGFRIGAIWASLEVLALNLRRRQSLKRRCCTKTSGGSRFSLCHFVSLCAALWCSFVALLLGEAWCQEESEKPRSSQGESRPVSRSFAALAHPKISKDLQSSSLKRSTDKYRQVICGTLGEDEA